MVQKPPTAQNYAIGSFGNVTGVGPFAGPAGYREGANRSGLQPQSLYLEQLAQRRNNSAPPDVTAPSAPKLSSTGKSSTSIDLTWTSSSDDVAVDGYNVFSNGRFVGFATGKSFTVTGLSGAASYTFTVRAADVDAPPTRLRVVGVVPAGRPSAQRVGAGEAMRIFTGAPLPQGADAVDLRRGSADDGKCARDGRDPRKCHAAAGAARGPVRFRLGRLRRAAVAAGDVSARATATGDAVVAR